MFVAVQSRKLEKQVEKLKVKTAQQAEDIERLRSENTEITSLQVHTTLLHGPIIIALW